jgi:hypothetical protein
MAAGDGLPSGDLAGIAPVSVGSLFEMAHDQGVPLRTLQGAIPADLSLDAEPAALIAGALEAGSIVVVPERPLDLAGTPRMGWWIIDPVTGQAVDQLDTGGGEMTEETEILTVNSAEWSAARAMSQLRAGQIRNIVRAMVTDPTVSIRRLRILERVLRFAAVRTLGR